MVPYYLFYALCSELSKNKFQVDLCIIQHVSNRIKKKFLMFPSSFPAIPCPIFLQPWIPLDKTTDKKVHIPHLISGFFSNLHNHQSFLQHNLLLTTVAVHVNCCSNHLKTLWKLSIQMWITKCKIIIAFRLMQNDSLQCVES